MRFPVLAVLALAAGACDEATRTAAGDLASPHVAAETLAISFEELYPTFLWRKSMSEGNKSTQWQRYRGRWVRWEGVIASITDKGVTLRQLLSTTTFDVSLTCDRSSMTGLKQRFTLGDRVRYVGMLDSYDDIFRTLYLSHGAVLAKVPHGDLGLPADMAHPVP